MNQTSIGLLHRAGGGDPLAWERLDSIYRPLIRGWLIGHGVRPQEADDLTQDVMLATYRGIEEFEHEGRVGSFRRWLRTITANRVRESWRSGRLPLAAGAQEELVRAADMLEDPSSDLRSEWDRAYEKQVLQRLLELMEREFEPTTIRAFRMLVLEGLPGSEVAATLGLSVPAVYSAKFRVLRRLRDEGRALLD